MKPLTVGVRGSRPGAGKDTVADIICEALAERGLRPARKRFATNVRRCVEVLTGVPVAVSETTEGKATELPAWGMTVGRMLQLLGTEAIRDNVHKDAWVLSLFAGLEPKEVAVISDVRFPNEAKAVRDRKGVVINVIRPPEAEGGAELAGRSAAHASEHGFDGGGEESAADIVIHNDGGLEELREKVLRAVGLLYGYTG